MDETLAGYTVGEGDRPTVLLHGFLGSGRNLRALATRWAARDPRRRFFLPDLRGHGESPPLRDGDDLQAIAADVLAAAEAAGFAPPLPIVGHSLGGRVALAAAPGGKVSEVVMLDIAPGAVDPALSESRRVLDVLLKAPAAVSDRREMRAFLIDRGLTPALADWLNMNLRQEGGGYGWRIDRRALDRLHDRFNRADLWPIAERAPVPVRCIRGGRSRYVSDGDVARLGAAGRRVDTLADAGHFLHVDALEPLVELLA